MQWSPTRMLLLLRAWPPPNCSCHQTRIPSCPDEYPRNPTLDWSSPTSSDSTHWSKTMSNCLTSNWNFTKVALHGYGDSLLKCHHHLTEMIFQAKTSDSATALFCELLSFLDCDQHYLLAGYFSKTMIIWQKKCSFSKNLVQTLTDLVRNCLPITMFYSIQDVTITN